VLVHVTVGVAVLVAVLVAVAVSVGSGVGVQVDVLVAVAVYVGRGVGVHVAVLVAVAVFVGRGVAVEVAVAVTVAVGVAVGVVAIGHTTAIAPENTPPPWWHRLSLWWEGPSCSAVRTPLNSTVFPTRLITFAFAEKCPPSAGRFHEKVTLFLEY